MKLKEYIDNLINEMFSISGLSKELINFLKMLEKDPKYEAKAKAIRIKVEQNILKSGDR